MFAYILHEIALIVTRFLQFTIYEMQSCQIINTTRVRFHLRHLRYRVKTRLFMHKHVNLVKNLLHLTGRGFENFQKF